MTDKMKLYDLQKDACPDNGVPFRSIQVFRCPVCKSLTNIIETRAGYYHSRHQQPICPHDKAQWHRDLKNKLFLLLKSHPASYRAELKQEIRALREQNTRNDLVGEPDVTSVKSFPKEFIRTSQPGVYRTTIEGVEDE